MERKYIAFNLVLGLMCGSLGFGLSQLTIVGVVNQHDVKLGQLERDQDKEAAERRQADYSVRQQIAEEREHTDKAITELVQLQRATIDQGKELITLLRVQNKLKTE